MRAIAKTGRTAIRFANGIVNTAALVAIMLLFAFGCYAIWDSDQVYHAADAARYETYKPASENGVDSFKGLQAVNPEVIAWLTVYGTHIDYPVTQADNNMKYINTDAKGKYSLSGAIFLDNRANPGFSDFSSIVYGHHMDKDTMFGEIDRFADKDYFGARRYGSLYYDGREHGIEFFAFIFADAYDNTVFREKIARADNQKAYLDMLIKKAVNLRADVPVTADDRIVLLSTCSSNSTNGRGILIGKITGAVHADPFKTDSSGKTKTIPVISALPGIWAQIPRWAEAGIAAALFLLVISAVVLVHSKKKKRSRGHDKLIGRTGGEKDERNHD